MSKVRIYELAKETGLPNREVIRRLQDLGIDARSHSSTVQSVDASRFRDSLGQQRDERRRAEEERAGREAEQYDLSAVRQAAPDAKARRILPPHLRRAQQAQQGLRHHALPPAARAAAARTLEKQGLPPEDGSPLNASSRWGGAYFFFAACFTTWCLTTWCFAVFFACTFLVAAMAGAETIGAATKPTAPATRRAAAIALRVFNMDVPNDG